MSNPKMWTLAELLEQLGNRQLDLERAAGGIKTLASVVPVVVDDIPSDLQRLLDGLAGRAESLALELTGLRWRLTDNVASRPPRPDLVVVPVNDAPALATLREKVGVELSAAFHALPTHHALLSLPQDLRDALQRVREGLVAAQLALNPPSLERMTATLGHGPCPKCGGPTRLVDANPRDSWVKCDRCRKNVWSCTCAPLSAGQAEDTATAAHLGDAPAREPRAPEPTPTTPPTKAGAVVRSFTGGLERYGWILEGWDATSGFRAAKDGRGVVVARTREQLVELAAARDVEHGTLATALNDLGWHFEGWHTRDGWSAWCRGDRSQRLASRDGAELLQAVREHAGRVEDLGEADVDWHTVSLLQGAANG